MAADGTSGSADDTADDIGNEEFCFTTFAALASPEQAAEAAVALYGQDAATAVAWCALTARYDGREGDYRFWVGVFGWFNGGVCDGCATAAKRVL